MIGINSFDIIETVGNLISDNVEDIDKSRSGDRWVFPTFTTTDSNLPQATVELGEVLYENDSAGNFLGEETLPNNSFKQYFYKQGVYPLHIYVLTGKSKSFDVNHNGKTLQLNNKPLNAYLVHKINNMLFLKRGHLLGYFTDFKIIGVSSVFENNKNSWSSDITCEIKAKEIWVKEYKEGKLVSTYSLEINII